MNTQNSTCLNCGHNEELHQIWNEVVKQDGANMECYNLPDTLLISVGYTHPLCRCPKYTPNRAAPLPYGRVAQWDAYP